MNPFLIKCENFGGGVNNVAPLHECAPNQIAKSKNYIWHGLREHAFQKGIWKKTWGYAKLNQTSAGSNSIVGIGRFYNYYTNLKETVFASNGSLYKYNDRSKAITAIYGALDTIEPVIFVNAGIHLYIGGKKMAWRRYDGGTVTDSVGGKDTKARREDRFPDVSPEGTRPPRCKDALFFKQRMWYFGTYDDTSDNPEGVACSEEDNLERLEHVTIFDSIKGDIVVGGGVLHGMIYVFMPHAIYSFRVDGVPDVWSVERTNALVGAKARDTIKKWKNQFVYLGSDLRVYAFPMAEGSQCISESVDFNINPGKAENASAFIYKNRWYVLCFNSKKAVTPTEYNDEAWICDLENPLLPWYGPINYAFNCAVEDENGEIIFGSSQSGLLYQLGGYDFDGGAIQGEIIDQYRSGVGTEFENWIKRFFKVHLKVPEEGNFNVTYKFGTREQASERGSRTASMVNDASYFGQPFITGTAEVDRQARFVSKRHVNLTNGLGEMFKLELTNSTHGVPVDIEGWEIETIPRYLKKW